jgi:hypothetical protein
MKMSHRALAKPLWSLRRKLSINAQIITKITRKKHEARTKVQNTPSRG